MSRRIGLVLGVVATMVLIAGLAEPKAGKLLVLEWAAKGSKEAPPLAILIEMGLQDENPTSWAGRATVAGAKVVHREGFRFRDGDKLVEPNGWEASSHRQPQRNTPPRLARAFITKTAPVGVVLQLGDVQPDATITLDEHGPNHPKITIAVKDILSGESLSVWGGTVAFRLVSAAMPVVTAKTEDDFPAAAYGPDGTLWVAYISYTLKDESRRAGKMQIAKQPDNFKDFYTPEFGDQLFVKYYRGGKWSEPLAITGPNEDLVRCAIAAEANGDVWVAYSANRQGSYDIYVRPIHGKEQVSLGAQQQLTKEPTPDLTPVMCTDQSGHPWLAFQSWSDAGQARIVVYQCKNGQWSEGPNLPGAKARQNRWYPTLAASPDGKVAVGYDVYTDGDYDVHVAIIDGKEVTDHLIAGTPQFEARPSLAYDPHGRLWIAHEVGPEQWGKDFGALDKKGHPLYDRRTVHVACLVDGKLQRPAAELPVANGPQQRPRQVAGERTAMFAYPKVGIDGQGQIWLTYRQKLFTPFGTQPGTNWVTVARRLDGDHWSAAVDLYHSDGLLDSRPVLLPHANGGLLAVTNTDGRYTNPTQLDNQIYASVIRMPGEAPAPKLVAADAGSKPVNAEESVERAGLRRIRAYTIDAAGKRLHFVRGEFHRHTEISFDGGNDGSLEDFFRYTIDPVALDWIGNTDHDSGNGREYTWWLIQKYSDAYHIGNAFTPVFAYERSVSYPMGHRNCIFVQRGVRTLPRLAESDPEKRVGAVHADDTKMLYRYLKELNGICASHTSATNMGTDWRDNDPVLEPVVEIYQGDRNNYEYEDAPRSGHDPQGNKLPASIGGWRPKGYVINALKDKGYRLGFQSSSDHISTHISFCVALAEGYDRASIANALRKRRCYAATDNIIVDVRSGKHLNGEEFKTDAAPSLEIHVIGVKPLAAVHVLKDSQLVKTFKPGQQEFQTTWTDSSPTSGTHYYYVRVEQSDDELAWSSPMWIDYTK